MTKEDRHLKYEAGEWGSKARKNDPANKRRNSMKKETKNELNIMPVVTMTEEEWETISHSKEFKEPSISNDMDKLKTEIKKLKQERNRWRQKAKSRYKFMWNMWSCKHTTKQMEKQFEELMRKMFDVG